MQPFWTPALTNVTGKVWLPTQAESEVVAKADYDATWQRLTSNTWFTTTLQQPSTASATLSDEWRDSQGISAPVLPANNRKKGSSTRGAATTKKKKAPELQAAKMMKIKAYPTTEQKEILRQWIGTCRWTYNQCVSYGKEHPSATIKELRANFVNNLVLKEKGLDWAVEVPYDIRDEAARDYLKAVASNKAKQQEKPDHDFAIKFKSRKMSSQETVNILGKHTRWDLATHDSLFFFTFAFPHPLQLAEALPAHGFVEIPGTPRLR